MTNHQPSSPEARSYTSASALRRPGTLIRQIRADFAGCWQLGWYLAARNIKGQYRQAFLGLFWAVIPPIATASLFLLLRANRVIDSGVTDVPYVVYTSVGVVLWQLFADTLVAPLRLVSQSKALLVKISFPREALLVSSVLETLFTSFIRAGVLAVVLVTVKFVPAATTVLLPLACLGIIIVGLSIGVLLLPLGLLYDDVTNLLGAVLPLWMLLTPVAYVAPTTGLLASVMAINPVAPILQFARSTLTTGRLDDGVVALSISGTGAVLLLLGWIVYRVSMPIVLERAGA